VLAVIWGARSVKYGGPSALDLLVPVALAITLGWWAIADAKLRGYDIPLFVQPWFLLLAGLVVPAYVLWSRKWRGVGWLILHAALWYAIATIALHAVGIIMWGEEWLSGLSL
jgi:hypothetical protein